MRGQELLRLEGVGRGDVLEEASVASALLIFGVTQCCHVWLLDEDRPQFGLLLEASKELAERKSVAQASTAINRLEHQFNILFGPCQETLFEQFCLSGDSGNDVGDFDAAVADRLGLFQDLPRKR